MFGDLYRSRLGGGFDLHILPDGTVTIKYPAHLIASNISTTPERTTRRIFEQLSAGVDTSFLLWLLHNKFVRNFSAAVPVH